MAPPAPGDDLVVAALTQDPSPLLAAWEEALSAGLRERREALSDADLHRDCDRFLAELRSAVQTSGPARDLAGAAWQPMLELLEELAAARAAEGFSATDTALLVLSLKQPLFSRLREQATDAPLLGEAMWVATELVDELALRTTEIYIATREAVIRRQQDEMLELSTPVVKLWPGILGIPLIGTLDSARTQVVMESLLERIVETDSPTAIIDITGVATVDTLVAQHLLKTVAAARLMGAECIISGIRPQIAQTIVQLGLDLTGVETRATLADALSLALDRMGFVVTRAG